MALVKMLVQLSGMRDGVEWPAAGEVLDVPTGEADDLVRMDLATHVPKPKTERAVIEPQSETATMKHTPKRAAARKR